MNSVSYKQHRSFDVRVCVCSFYLLARKWNSHFLKDETTNLHAISILLLPSCAQNIRLISICARARKFSGSKTFIARFQISKLCFQSNCKSTKIASSLTANNCMNRHSQQYSVETLFLIRNALISLKAFHEMDDYNVIFGSSQSLWPTYAFLFCIRLTWIFFIHFKEFNWWFFQKKGGKNKSKSKSNNNNSMLQIFHLCY